MLQRQSSLALRAVQVYAISSWSAARIQSSSVPAFLYSYVCECVCVHFRDAMRCVGSLLCVHAAKRAQAHRAPSYGRSLAHISHRFRNRNRATVQRSRRRRCRTEPRARTSSTNEQIRAREHECARKPCWNGTIVLAPLLANILHWDRHT